MFNIILYDLLSWRWFPLNAPSISCISMNALINPQYLSIISTATHKVWWLLQAFKQHANNESGDGSMRIHCLKLSWNHVADLLQNSCDV